MNITVLTLAVMTLKHLCMIISMQQPYQNTLGLCLAQLSIKQGEATSLVPSREAYKCPSITPNPDVL